MHTFLPHPHDHLVILQVRDCFEPADHEAIALLLEERINQHGRIQLLLQIDTPSNAAPAWAAPLLHAPISPGLERLALVASLDAAPAVEALAVRLPDTTIRHFPEVDLPAALHWVQTGGDA